MLTVVVVLAVSAVVYLAIGLVLLVLMVFGRFEEIWESFCEHAKNMWREPNPFLRDVVAGLHGLAILPAALALSWWFRLVDGIGAGLKRIRYGAGNVER